MERDIEYLKCLSELFPNIKLAAEEMINLQSILYLPKGTEHFMSDIHGEYDAFSHVLKNGSGAVQKKINDVFGHTLGNDEKNSLATLIYYPKERIHIARENISDIENWYQITIYRLIEICRITASKYTRSKVRKALPKDYAYVIEELITEKPEVLNKEAYYDSIVNAIIESGQAESLIIELCNLIQRLVTDRIHIVGDIFDRGPYPHKIMDRLMNYHSLDIQWGNHDILWMGAAAGQTTCIATVVRNCVQYNNLDILEDGYGINMLPLVTFAMETYKDDPCERFKVKGNQNNSDQNPEINAKTHKAIAVILFKLEGQLIQEYPEYNLNHRLLLDKIDWDYKTVTIDDELYQLLDTNFPTIDKTFPYQLTDEEAHIVKQLKEAFIHCEKLQKHVHFLLNQGSMYKIYNDNLLYHGCMPLTKEGTFLPVNVYGEEYSGKALYDVLEKYVRQAFFSKDEQKRKKGRDIMWYIWCAPGSPLFGKNKMTTFEHYMVADKDTYEEEKNSYYDYLENPKIVNKIFKEFGLNPENSHIINGHVPVHQKEGEDPVKCNGKVIVIDGGFSKPYQKVTGIAGYTLIYNSYGMTLASHEPFVSREQAIIMEEDIVSKRKTVFQSQERLLVKDTDAGKEMAIRIADIKQLLEAYRNGLLIEKDNI